MRTVHPFPGPATLEFTVDDAQVIDPSLLPPTTMATSPTAPYESRSVSPAQAHVLDSLVSQLAAQAAAQGGTPGPGQGRPVEGDGGIHNILSTVSPQPTASAGTEQPPWSVNPGPSNGRPPPPPEHTSTLGKRKNVDNGDDGPDPNAKIRRVVRDHVTQNIQRMIPMTTVVCLHAAVAQKSYGTEKRFLCPPPVVHIEGPVWHMRSQLLGMSVVAETGERSFDQKTPLDNNMAASFKFLHVTGTAKAKSFQLSLDIFDPEPEGRSPGGGRVWASFDSAPVTIISKPSKKTAKTRNISSCILAGGPVSLFNRINSQTVRTKYMTIDQAQLCASNLTWSAFNVNVVRRSTDSTPMGGPTPVTYGSEIVLSDTHSGISTAPLVVRKVDKGRIVVDDGSPVSQMQKIALQRVNPDGSRHYLSAAGPIPGTPGVVPPPAPGTSQQAGTHPLLFQSPRVHEEEKDGIRVVVDEVDDYLCWTIVGISKFQYTFFDASGESNRVPELPITPFPTLFSSPVYRPQNNALELTVLNFFYDHPETRAQAPLDVYLGSIGPLPARVYQGDAAPHRYAAVGHMHSIVVIDMPSISEIMDALAEDAMYAARGAVSPDQEESRNDGDRRRRKEKTAPPLPPQALIGRTLPLLFVRARDGVGYHSGRTIALDNVFAQMDMNPHGPSQGVDSSWVAAAQAASGGSASPEASGWTMRVM